MLGLSTTWKALMRGAFRFYVPDDRITIHDRLDWWNSDGDESFSEYGQDVFVLNRLFRGKSDGVFVDVGGNHPVDCNNTFLLEKRGWRGVAIEPQDRLCRLWPEQRSTPCMNIVVGPGAGTVEFVQGTEDEHGVSGVAGYNKVSGSKSATPVRQQRLDDVVRQHEFDEIDALFIDVEGYEMHVLQGIDLQAVNVRCIVVENDRGFDRLPFFGRKIAARLGSNTIRRYLMDQGYKQVARLVSDDVFVKRLN